LQSHIPFKIVVESVVFGRLVKVPSKYAVFAACEPEFRVVCDPVLGVSKRSATTGLVALSERSKKIVSPPEIPLVP
jgi:hypothetical protein